MFFSPLRYPGGKNKLAKYFQKVCYQNGIENTYVEPYAGGASVALSLLFTDSISKIVINDIDRSIYSFWYCVLNKTEQLNRMIFDTSVNLDNWIKQKFVQKTKGRQNLLNLGFSTLFINRTNRSGILNAGVIGGRDQSGKWKIDARFNKRDIIDRIERIAKNKSRIMLYNMDAVELIKKINTEPNGDVLFYLDPPYYIKGKKLYLNYYNHDDHLNVADQIKKIKKNHWIVTYDNVKEIKELYKPFRYTTYNLNYSISKASTGKELMFFSDSIELSKDTRTVSI